MKSNLKFFKNKKSLPVDKFLQNVLYDKKFGYYSSKIPFCRKGDFITAPTISNLYSELISIWIISTWEKFGKPKKINMALSWLLNVDGLRRLHFLKIESL